MQFFLRDLNLVSKFDRIGQILTLVYLVSYFGRRVSPSMVIIGTWYYYIVT